MVPVYFIGFTTHVSRPSFICEPVPPSNYKDKEAIARYKAATKERWQQEASDCPGLSSVVNFVVYNKDGRLVMSDTGAPVSPASTFWSGLSDLRASLRPGNPVFVGFRIKQFMETMTLDGIVTGAPDLAPWDPWNGLVDPYEMLFSNSVQRKISLPKAIEMLLGRVITEQELYNNPRDQAVLACAMTMKARLLGPETKGVCDELAAT